MSKKSLSGLAWGKASDDLKAKVKFVLQQAQHNRYSVSRIYAAHNAIFELDEAPQTCATCLTSRAAKLRKWWHENEPAIKVTGEVQDATSYEGVVSKYSIKFDADTEASVLAPFITAGVSEPIEGGQPGITANELALLQERADQLKDAQDGAALDEFYKSHEAKLAELGVTDQSSNEDRLEALEVLRAGEDLSPEDIAHFDARINIPQTQIEADNLVMDYTGLVGKYAIEVGETKESERDALSEVIEVGGLTPTELTIANARYDELQRDIAAVNADKAMSQAAGLNAPKQTVKEFVISDDAMSLLFTPNADEDNKGTVAWTDGSKVKAGTYVSKDGVNIAVQVGGKATIK